MNYCLRGENRIHKSGDDFFSLLPVEIFFRGIQLSCHIHALVLRDNFYF